MRRQRSAHSFDDRDLQCGATYYYRVYAKHEGDSRQSLHSNVVSTTTPICALRTPIGIDVTEISDTELEVRWQDTTTDEGAFYIERKAYGANIWEELGSVGPNVNTYIDTVEGSAPYSYRVRVYRAVDDAYSDYSSVGSGYTELCPPTDLQVQQWFDMRIEITWDYPTDLAPTFLIERSTDQNAEWQLIGSTLGGQLFFDDTGIDCSAAYHYRIRAFDEAKEKFSPYSAPVDQTTSSCITVKPPEALAPVQGALAGVELHWRDAPPDETTFHIERSTDDQTNWALIDVVGANETTYQDNITDCRIYHYRLRSFRTSDHQYSAFSNIVNATPSNCTNLYIPIIRR
ncbi:MAG: fibronectin type III domain-containing protein [Caldilineaceae bacterium]|nr:fibronectin type III domain-containing protein [Caldilineaceae bacterium]